jgi:hypothetical protein
MLYRLGSHKDEIFGETGIDDQGSSDSRPVSWRRTSRQVFWSKRQQKVMAGSGSLTEAATLRCGVPNMTQNFKFFSHHFSLIFLLFLLYFLSLSNFFSYIHSDILRYY